MSRVTPDLLASCLSEVKSGRMTIEGCVGAHAEVAEELRRLLVTAATLRPQLRVEPDPAFRLRARVAMVEAISAEKSASGSRLGRLEGWLSPFWRDPARLASMRISRPALVVVLVIVLSGVVGGGATFASQSALPSDTLYPVKITVEGLQVRLIPGEEHKAEAHVVCAERRLDEAQRALEMGRSADVASAMDAYSRCLTLAEESLSRADASGHEVIEVATRLSAQLASQHEKLAATEVRAPEEARAIWSRALEDSNRGMDTTIAIADRKERAGDRREAAPTIPPTRTATPPPGGTPARGGDDGESRPTPVSATPGVLETKLAQALSDVQRLKDDPAVSRDNYEGLQGKLLAVREAIERGRNNAALNELGAFLGQLNAMRQSGHINAGSYALLYSDYASLVGSLGGTPGPQAEPNRSTPTSGPLDDSPQPKAGSGDDEERRGTTPTAGPEWTATPGWRVSPTPEGRPDGYPTDPTDPTDPEDKAAPAPSPVRVGTPTPTPTSQDDSRSRPDGRGGNLPQPAPAPSPTQPSQDDSRSRPDGRGNNLPQPAPASTPSQRSEDGSRSRADGRGENSPKPTSASTPTRVPSSPTARPDPDPTSRSGTPIPSASPTQSPPSATPRSDSDGGRPSASPTQAPPSATPRSDSDRDRRPTATPDPTQRPVQASPSPAPPTPTPSRARPERETNVVLTATPPPTPTPTPPRSVR